MMLKTEFNRFLRQKTSEVNDFGENLVEPQSSFTQNMRFYIVQIYGRQV